MINFLNKCFEKYRKIPIAGKAAIWLMFCDIVRKSLSLLTTPVFTRIMNVEQFGQFSIYNSWLQIFTIITTFRLSWAVFNKGMSKYKTERDAYTSTMQSITFVFALIWLFVYLIFRNSINKLTELPTFIMFIMFIELLFSPAIDFWTIRKRYEYIYKPIVFRTVLMLILNVCIGVIAVLFSKEKGYARILSAASVNIVFGIILFYDNLKKGKTLFVSDYAKFAIAFNLPLLMHYFSQYVLDQFDRIMIQKLVSISAAGIYNVAYSAGLVMKLITNSINNAFVPWEYDKLEKGRIQEIDNMLFYIFISVGYVTILFSAFAPEIMYILADKKYFEAVYVIPAIALSTFFSFAYTVYANIEFFYEETKYTMYISIIGAGLNILLNYIFIKQFGYIAAAYTTLVCYILFFVFHFIYMHKCVKKAIGNKCVFNIGRLIKVMLLITISGIMIIAFYPMPLIRYFIVLITIVFLYIKRNKLMNLYFRITDAEK